MKLSSKWAWVVACALIFSFSSYAQETTGSIRGTVLDSSGGTVSGVSVSATQIETGLQRSVTTDSSGAYVILALPVGHYRVEAEAKGFQKFIRDRVTLDVNQNADLSFHLVVGGASYKVEVNSDASLIESTATSLGKTVQEREILDLPLNGRNFTQLGVLQPGVVPITPGLATAGGSLREGQAYAVNGQRPESNNFLIDGADNFNGVDGGYVMALPVDAISEFRILTHTANAEFGHSTGSTTNIITRSGTNSYHGALWEFIRNDAFDAKSFFAQDVEPLKRNQFGGTFGGPVKHDKTFFFLYYEGLRNRQGETTVATVPTLAERGGDFSELCPMGFNAGGVCNDPDPSHGHQIYNVFVPPHTPPQPIPFNQLPGINSISQNILAFYPLPNLGNNQFVTTQSKPQNGDQFGVRFDHYLTSKDTLNFRYSFNQGNVTDPLSTSGANVPGFPVGEDQRAQNFVATETHTFSPSLVGLVRFSFLRNKFLFDEHINHTDLASLGFSYSPSLDVASGPPFVQVAGFASVGDPITGPRNSYQNTFDLNGSFTWIRGRHELKFGGGYGHDQINVLQGIATNGFFVFVNAPLTNPFASFLIGQPIFFLQGSGDFGRGLRGNNLNAYAQDTFKISSRFTLNYGLRYEIPFPYTEVKNRANLFEPGVQSIVHPEAPAGLVYPGDPGVPRGLIQTKKDAFAPRIGLAWDPTGSGKWRVTSSYGIFYDPFYTGQGGPLQDPISAPPYLQTAQINVPNFADPYAGLPPPVNGFTQPMTLLVLNKDLKLPYAQDWNLNFQRAFGSDWLFEAGYIGTKGTHLPRFIEGNPTTFEPGDTSQTDADRRRLYSGCTRTDTNPCTFSSVGEIAGTTNSSYNALQASLKKRFSHGLSFLASYTYSKSIDDVSSFNITGSASQSTAGENDLAQNPFDLGAERGRSMFDARHRFVISYQWNLPFFEKAEGWKRVALGGWQVNGITTFMSGTPFTVYDSAGASLQGGAPEISGFPSDRPNVIGDFTKGTCPNPGGQPFQAGTPNCWISPDGFQRLDPIAGAGQFGNAGRNIAQGPGFQQWDFSALKNFRITETKTIQFRGELFNIFNHANLGLPVNDMNSSNFGQIQTSQPGRLVQFALKFLF
ncbi:MAG TPA: carboxypeptidase regulatory-like domain-containing protein [Candidatus Dormibacteraeota bacterium]|jgi:outer membrane receptor protein involved in Fe transport|nr:carboxypeptidase regulatory-like domain-containing protein [Candidatus Dormibacteraeota bacterium]